MCVGFIYNLMIHEEGSLSLSKDTIRIFVDVIFIKI